MRFYTSEESYEDELWFVGRVKGQVDGEHAYMWSGSYCIKCGDFWIRPNILSYTTCQKCRIEVGKN